MGNLDSQDSPWPGLGGIHHLPPYSILCASPWGPHPNGFLSRDSQMEIPKLPMLGLPRLWGLIILSADLRLRWGLNQSCISRQELSNGMSHTTWKQGNLVDSRLLVVESQIANLTSGLSISHNLCFRCSNGSCKPIADIYIAINFQWYKGLFNAMGFDPCNLVLKIRESTGTSTPKVRVSLGVWGSIPSQFLTFPGACDMTLSFPLGPQPCNPLHWLQTQR
jgi:hypothetical protein